jgi:hypothetical protein
MSRIECTNKTDVVKLYKRNSELMQQTGSRKSWFTWQSPIALSAEPAESTLLDRFINVPADKGVKK